MKRRLGIVAALVAFGALTIAAVLAWPQGKSSSAERDRKSVV